MRSSSNNGQSAYNGNWLRAMRLKKGLHQHQLAAKIDVNQGRVSEWENGIKPIPPERLEQVKIILN